MLAVTVEATSVWYHGLGWLQGCQRNQLHTGQAPAFSEELQAGQGIWLPGGPLEGHPLPGHREVTPVEL